MNAIFNLEQTTYYKTIQIIKFMSSIDKSEKHKYYIYYRQRI